MRFEEVANKVVKDTADKSWQFAVKNVLINFDKVDINNIDFIDGYESTITKLTISGLNEFSNIDGYIFGSNIGLLLFCPNKNNFPIVDFIYSKEIRVIEAETKLFKSDIRIRTNGNCYIFKVNKKKVYEIEKFIEKIRKF